MTEEVDVAETLARWAARDAAIGLDAELTEARLAITAADAQIADLRERNQRQAQRIAQLVTERDSLARQVAVLERSARWKRMYRRGLTAAQRAARSRF